MDVVVEISGGQTGKSCVWQMQMQKKDHVKSLFRVGAASEQTKSLTNLQLLDEETLKEVIEINRFSYDMACNIAEQENKSVSISHNVLAEICQRKILNNPAYENIYKYWFLFLRVTNKCLVGATINLDGSFQTYILVGETNKVNIASNLISCLLEKGQAEMEPKDKLIYARNFIYNMFTPSKEKDATIEQCRILTQLTFPNFPFERTSNEEIPEISFPLTEKGKIQAQFGQNASYALNNVVDYHMKIAREPEKAIFPKYYTIELSEFVNKLFPNLSPENHAIVEKELGEKFALKTKGLVDHKFKQRFGKKSTDDQEDEFMISVPSDENERINHIEHLLDIIFATKVKKTEDGKIEKKKKNEKTFLQRYPFFQQYFPTDSYKFPNPEEKPKRKRGEMDSNSSEPTDEGMIPEKKIKEELPEEEEDVMI